MGRHTIIPDLWRGGDAPQIWSVPSLGSLFNVHVRSVSFSLFTLFSKPFSSFSGVRAYILGIPENAEDKPSIQARGLKNCWILGPAFARQPLLDSLDYSL